MINDDLAAILEKQLRCQIILQEGLEAVGARVLWNWQGCTYDGKCYYQAEREKSRPKPCSFNPSMFQCPAYQHYELQKLGQFPETKTG
jgi:hypothetical protein